jgi:CRISPR-associated endonuclease/helicase Cas3
MNFQRECGAALRAGKSVLVVAPTGLGKTRAALSEAAATTGGLLGTRVVYTLPMRALAWGIKEQFDDLLQRNGCNWSATIHHGQTPDSETFRERAIITTIDQYLTGFAGAPLSFTSRDGHSAAGAMLTSYSVFDEVHLLDAKAGLPLLFAMLHQRQRWGLLSCVMTATLPESVIKHFEKTLELKVIHASETDVNKRDDHRKVTVRYTDAIAPVVKARVPGVVEAWKTHGRVLVFCNTVPNALDLYHALCEEAGEDHVLLAHSRFAPSDRRTCDRNVSKRFGIEGEGGILVSTQVSEAGLNISAPVVFSELAPADALIQRAGRCSRFFRHHTVTAGKPLQGEFIVWPIFPQHTSLSEEDRKQVCLPYDPGVVEATQVALMDELDNNLLTWQRETEFVNRSLSDFYSVFVSGQEFTKAEIIERRKTKQPLKDKGSVALTPSLALGAFERAFHTADASQVEKLLRDSVTVNVGVVESFEAALSAYNTPETDGSGSRQPRSYPETISLRLSTFAILRKRNEWQVREILVRHKDKLGKEYIAAEETPMQLQALQRIRPGATYLLLAGEAGYTSKTGLSIHKEVGTPTKMLTLLPRDRGQRQQNGTEQTWIEHATGVHEEAKRILDLYDPFLLTWAKQVYANIGVAPEETAGAVRDAMELAALFHDVGKLNDKWQRAVGRENKQPLARTLNRNSAPYHAQYVFPLLVQFFHRATNTKYRLYEHIGLAAARHHVLTLDGDINTGDERFRWTPGGKKAVLKAFEATFGIDGLSSLEASLDSLEETQTAGEAPGPSADEFLPYCLTNRLVKFSDICDAGAGRLELFTSVDIVNEAEEA